MGTVRGYILGYIEGNVIKVPKKGDSGIVKAKDSGALLPFYMQDIETSLGDLKAGDTVEYRHKGGKAIKVRKI